MAATAVTTTMAGAINYTYVTDSSADWASVPNSTYFYDKADKLVHYKDGSGTVLEIFAAGGGGLTYFTEAENTSAPNGTVYVDSLTAAASSTNADFAIVPKGTGAIVAAVPNNLTSGGNKRGEYAVDWQLLRNANTQVASGNRSVILGGYNNIASGTYSLAFGSTSSATNDYSIAIGQSAVSSGNNSISLGYANTASNTGATALGYSNTSNSAASFSAGDTNTASGSRAVAIGQQNTASGANSTSIGYNNIASGQGAIATGVSNTASGGASFAGGNGSSATGSYSFSFGYYTQAGGAYSYAIGRQASATNESYAFGWGANASGQYALALGTSAVASGTNSVGIGKSVSTLGITGRQTQGYANTVTGDCQKSLFPLSKRTTDDTATTLTIGGGAAGTTNQVILSNQSGYRFKGTIIGKQSGSTNVAAWDVDGLIVRGANAAATTLIVSNVNVVDNTPTFGTPTLAADTTNGGLRVQVTGVAATNIQWTASIETTEVIYA